MNITEHARRCAALGVNLSFRTSGICKWARIAVTLQSGDQEGVSLLFGKELDESVIDIVGMRIDHALQDLFCGTRRS